LPFLKEQHRSKRKEWSHLAANGSTRKLLSERGLTLRRFVLLLRFVLLSWRRLLLLLSRRRLLTLRLWSALLRRRLLALSLRWALLLMLLLLALLHLLLLLIVFSLQVLELPLLLLLHLLSALIVRPLLIRLLTLLHLLLFYALALLVLLPAHVLQLLLMLLLQSRIAVRRRIRWLSSWRPIVRPVVGRRTIRLRTRRWRIRAFGISRSVRLCSRWRRVRSVIRVRWPRRRWPVRSLAVWPVRRPIRLRIRLWRIVRPVGRTVLLRIVRLDCTVSTVRLLLHIARPPFVCGPIILLSIVLLNIPWLLLHGPIHVLRRRLTIARISLWSRHLPRRRSHPNRSRSPALLLRFRLANL
jgi:hypothetical protein